MKKKLFVIGVTGGIATGKSTVAAIFGKLGAAVIDADRISRDLLDYDPACIRKVVRLFGQDVLRRGKPDRKKIAAIVFRDKEQLKKLEQIIHPRVRRVIQARLGDLRKQPKVRFAVLDVPLLFEAGFDAMADLTVAVRTSRTIQIERGCRQAGMSAERVARRIRSQMPMADKVRRADAVIDNSGTKRETQKQVVLLWERLLRRYGFKNSEA